MLFSSLIKEAIAKSLASMSPNFDKEFIIYMFASKSFYVVVLTHKNPEGSKVPIYFMSSRLQGS
jgi:hypothetical protein